MENAIQLQVIAESLHSRLQNNAIHIPRLPDIALAVLDLAHTPGAQPAQLTDILNAQPALTARLLEVVNSGFYGSIRHEHLASAVVHLGLCATADLIVAVSLNAGLFYAPGYYQCIVEQLRQSIQCGIWAREIALLRRRRIEAAFLCGLLKSIGRPVVMEAALESAVRHRMHLNYGDLLVLADQFEYGATQKVLAEWRMPEVVHQVAEHWLDHHHAGEAREQALTTAAGARLASYCGRECGNDSLRSLSRDLSFAELGISGNALQSLLAMSGRVANLSATLAR